MVKFGKETHLFFLIAAFVVIIDQLCKLIATKVFSESYTVIKGVLSIGVIKNYGAGFGILQGQSILLISISFIVIVAIIYYHKDFIKESKILVSLALILGGAIGNLIDRVMFGFVVDFVNFSFWPAFNIADSAITIGAAGLIYYFLRN